MGTSHAADVGSHDFCSVVTSFQVRVIMQAQLDTLSQVMVWGMLRSPMGRVPPNCAKHCCWIQEDLQPCCSMGASMPGLLHNPSGCGVQAHAAHGWQHWLGVCLFPVELGPVTCTPVQCGHISTMTDGASSTDASSWLHQFQVHKLLKYQDLLVCPEGLNGQMEASQFTFKELPLWNATTPSEPAC